MALNDMSDLEISLIVVQWEIVTISIERMGDWKNKPNSNHTGTVVWAPHNAYYLFLFLITGLEQFYADVLMFVCRWCCGVVKGFVDMPSHTIPQP